MEAEWIRVSDHRPQEGAIVDTKIDDEKGVRNYSTLKRHGNLWFFEDGSMYVYYVPTHWKPRDKNSYFSGFDSVCEVK